jgi:rubrerythrin
MDPATQEMIEGLKQAMAAERHGFTFYQTAAANTQDAKGRQVFEQLAQEELGHFEFLAQHYRSLLATGLPDGNARLASHAPMGQSTPIFSDALRARIKEAHFEMSALAIAIQLELNAMTHYREQARKATVPAVKQFFAELAEWETGHYHAFLAEQQSLQQDYWHANGFERF